MPLWSMQAWRPFMPIKRPYSAGSCCCGYGGVSIGHSLLPGSVFQYSTPTCGQPPMPAGEPHWPLRGPHHVGHLFSGTWIGIPFGRWARVVVAAPHWSSSSMAVPPACTSGFLGRTGCPSIGACRAVSQVTFLVNILHGRGP